jgi:APA family basic amino acid/polyamine antiporter
VPRYAEIAVGIVVAVLAATVDLRGAIGFSSFGVLVYYAVANCAAWTLRRGLIPAAGLVGCVALAISLPLASVVTGATVLAAGALVYLIRSKMVS